MKKFAIFSAVMIIGAGIALAQTLTVPFYRDGATGARNTSAFIGIKNTTASDQVITIVYTSLDASGAPADMTVTYALGAFLAVQWQPVQDLQTEGVLGRAVPNNTIPGSVGGVPKLTGSLTIDGTGLAGMYREIDFTNSGAFGHTIGPV